MTRGRASSAARALRNERRVRLARMSIAVRAYSCLSAYRISASMTVRCVSEKGFFEIGVGVHGYCETRRLPCKGQFSPVGSASPQTVHARSP